MNPEAERLLDMLRTRGNDALQQQARRRLLQLYAVRLAEVLNETAWVNPPQDEQSEDDAQSLSPPTIPPTTPVNITTDTGQPYEDEQGDYAGQGDNADQSDSDNAGDPFDFLELDDGACVGQELEQAAAAGQASLGDITRAMDMIARQLRQEYESSPKRRKSSKRRRGPSRRSRQSRRPTGRQPQSRRGSNG